MVATQLCSFSLISQIPKPLSVLALKSLGTFLAFYHHDLFWWSHKFLSLTSLYLELIAIFISKVRLMLQYSIFQLDAKQYTLIIDLALSVKHDQC